ncbi:MAG: flavodoxin domain-containing protein [Candidatus Heimdallarchaeota archaeon]
MKCAFVYFSGTGITPKYAYEIAKGITSKEICTFDFIRLKKGKEFNLSSYDVIGIGAPSYSFRAPRLATRLIRRMNFQRKPFFVFATYNTKAGNTLWNLYRAVKRSAGICLGFQQGSITVNRSS